MTGAELFEALSFVDEKYVQEAENANLRRSTPWMKVLSVAACLCVLITGVYAYSRMQQKTAAPEAAAPAVAIPESVVEEAAPAETPAATAAAPKEESVTVAPEEPLPVEEEVASNELQHIPYAQLRILGKTEDGFAVVVEAVSEDPTPLETGMELTIVFDASMVPGNTREVMTDTDRLTENTPVAVEDAAYDAGTNTLYVVEVFLLREAE